MIIVLLIKCIISVITIVLGGLVFGYQFGYLFEYIVVPRFETSLEVAKSVIYMFITAGITILIVYVVMTIEI